MSDEQKRIEELEQQLKIAKLEKELAEMKGVNKEKSVDEQLIENQINKENKVDSPTQANKDKINYGEDSNILFIKIAAIIFFGIVGFPIFHAIFGEKIDVYNPETRTYFSVASTNELKQYEKPSVIDYKGKLFYYDGKKTSGGLVYMKLANMEMEGESFDCMQADLDIQTLGKTIRKACKTSKSEQETNNEPEYYIGDEEIIVKTYNYKGIDIEYDSNSNSISEITTAAEQCYNEGNTDSESLNQCIGVKLHWF